MCELQADATVAVNHFWTPQDVLDYYNSALAFFDNRAAILPLWAHSTQGHTHTSELASFQKVKHLKINLLNRDFQRNVWLYSF